MWYFAWILGILLACSFGIINVMWYEFQSGGFENENDEADEADDK